MYCRGGLEILFGNERKHKVTLPTQLDNGTRPNISYLLQYLVNNLMKDQRKELFVLEDNVYVFPARNRY
jgi:ubiquitin related modifier 1